MDKIVLLTKGDLLAVFDTFEGMKESGVYQVRISIDEGGVKFKGNNCTWTPPYGTIEH